MKKVILMSVTAACLAALSLVYLPATSASGSGKNEVTYNKDVASIIYNNCAVCHRPNDIAPMSLMAGRSAISSTCATVSRWCSGCSPTAT